MESTLEGPKSLTLRHTLPDDASGQASCDNSSSLMTATSMRTEIADAIGKNLETAKAKEKEDVPASKSAHTSSTTTGSLKRRRNSDGNNHAYYHPAMEYSKEQIDNLPDSKVDELLSIGVLADIPWTQTAQDVDSRDSLMMLKRWCLKRVTSFTDGTLNMELTNIKHNHTIRIDTDTANPPVHARPYRANPANREAITKEVQHKLKIGIIEPSSSPWSSNVIVVRRDGKVRLVTDYRILNKHTIKDQYTLPKISDLFDVLQGAKYFSTADACQAYHQLPLADERSKDLTSFITPDGSTYRYKYCSFGLVNAPAAWSRLIDTCLSSLRWDVVLVYMDDCLIWTKTSNIQDHITALDKVFDALDSYGIKMKASKCLFGVRRLPFLGHVLTTDGIEPDPNKVKAISEMTLPTSAKEVQSQLGTFSYYRKFIKHFADISAPLSDLTKGDVLPSRTKGRKLELNSTEIAAWKQLKNALVSEPIMLWHPNWSETFVLDTDASPIGVSAVLSQNIDGKERVIMYASRKLSDAERKYHQYEREALAFVWATDLLRPYLYGKKFILRTDNAALKYIDKLKDNKSRIMRWVMRLQEFTFEVKHRPGKLNGNADGPSRTPLDSTSPYGEDPVEPLYDCAEPIQALFANSYTFAVQTRTQTKATQPDSATSAQKSVSHDTSTNTVTKNVEPDGDDIELPLATGKTDTKTNTSFFGTQDKEAWSQTDFITQQHDGHDPVLNEIILKLRSAKDNTTKSRFAIVDGVVVVKSNNEHSLDKIVVPDSLKSFILGMHHGLPLTGHTGFKHTYQMIKRRYWWPNFKKHIRAWVKACSLCTRRKTPRPLKSGLTESMNQNRPWHTAAIDIVGPCLPNSRGDRWILTVIDTFTRYPIAIPLPNRKAETIMKALYEHVICHHGIPSRILSDQAKEFVDSGIKLLCEHWNIAKIETTGYNSTGNSHVERFHRYLNAAMTILYHKRSIEWETFLPAVLFSYRVTVNNATGFSPAYLMYGRDPTLPAESIFNSSSLSGDSFTSDKEYANHIEKNLRAAFTLAREAQTKAAATNRLRLDASRRSPPDFKPGVDRVYYWYNSSTDHRVETPTGYEPLRYKWSYWWQGPFEIVKRISDKHYAIKVGDKLIKANVNRLTRHTPWSADNPDTATWTDHIDRVQGKPSFVRENTSTRPLAVGQTVIFGTNMTDDYPCPFGVAKLLELPANESSDMKAQWMGNFHNTINGTYKPSWYQTNTDQWYYAMKPQRSTCLAKHVPYTLDMTNISIKPQDVILNGFDLIGSDHKLQPRFWEFLKTHALIAPRLPAHLKQP